MGTRIEAGIIGLAVDGAQPNAAYTGGYLIGTLLIPLVIFLAGIAAISTGAKGFSQTGMLLTKQTSITGGQAKAIGVVCILTGLVFVVNSIAMLVALGLR